MSAAAKQRDPIVGLMLNGGRVTASFRAALFAAASRAGLSVSEFCLKATAEHLAAQGYGFTGVFEDGDMSAKAMLDPFAGDQSRAVINFGADGVYVTAAEKVAFDLHKPKGMAWVAWAVELMREKVISNVRRVA
jgi:hypothetical protein